MDGAVRCFLEPALVVDGAGCVVEMNEAATRLVRICVVAETLQGSLLVPTVPAEVSSLRAAVELATGTERVASGMVTISNRQGVRVTFWVTPVAWPRVGECGVRYALLLCTRIDETVARLSPQQRRIADLASSGATNDEIARTLGTGSETIRTHIKEIYRRLAVASRLELARRMAGLDDHGGAIRSSSSQ